MRLLGFEITRAKAATPTYPVSSHTWWPLIREPYTGAWQRNMEIRPETLATYHAVYSCITLIASDVAKCRLRLVEEVQPDIWEEVRDVNSPFLPVLRKPNAYQNRIQFYENWVISKLTQGNTYVYKERDARGVVIGLYVLDPLRTKPLVGPDGDVFYQLSQDNLAGIPDTLIVPASEIIHDLASLRYHPLCGIPPMAPAALAATHGINIQRSSITLFGNDATPGGILVAPTPIDDDAVRRLKQQWEEGFRGDNRGRIAVLPNNMKFEPIVQNAVDSQLIEQLGISAKMVCSSFNVPPYKVQVGDTPAYNNVGALNIAYYCDCLQKHLEAIELALDEGLGLTKVVGKRYGTEFDTDSLFRMDSATMMKSLSDGVRGGFLAPNEARKRLGYRPAEGGDSPMMQHQDYSLAALAKRDAKADPFATAKPPAQPKPNGDADEPDREDADGEDVEATRMLLRLELKQRLDDMCQTIERDISNAA